jgi:oxaloacetate decarboxylase alpha subunit/pyruvate carboxylase subunit B
MPGMIIKYMVKAGDAVKEGDAIVVLEAMKMENSLVAPRDGKVQGIKFASGDTVAKGAVLCVIG